MAYFLRFTNTANQDLERGTSVNWSDYKVGTIKPKKVAELFGCDEDNIGEFEGNYCQVLNGLCGYELEANTLEEAIEEVEDNAYQFSYVGKAVIFSGKYSNDANFVADGDLFIPFKIVHQF